jgi:hypothetical protein
MSQSGLGRDGTYPSQLTQRVGIDRHFLVKGIISTHTLQVHNHCLLHLLLRCTQHLINPILKLWRLTLAKVFKRVLLDVIAVSTRLSIRLVSPRNDRPEVIVRCVMYLFQYLSITRIPRIVVGFQFGGIQSLSLNSSSQSVFGTNWHCPVRTIGAFHSAND